MAPAPFALQSIVVRQRKPRPTAHWKGRPRHRTSPRARRETLRDFWSAHNTPSPAPRCRGTRQCSCRSGNQNEPRECWGSAAPAGLVDQADQVGRADPLGRADRDRLWRHRAPRARCRPAAPSRNRPCPRITRPRAANALRACLQPLSPPGSLILGSKSNSACGGKDTLDATKAFATGQVTGVQVPSGLRQAVPRSVCGLPSI
jgi:hypothetical protein